MDVVVKRTIFASVRHLTLVIQPVVSHYSELSKIMEAMEQVRR
jgi:hypothetical protein